MEINESHFLHRELSWLEFNRRVLHEAVDSRTPLLERLRFLDIFYSNLDEFFMKRVGGLKRQVLAQVASSGLKKLSPREQLAEIRKKLAPILEEHVDCITRLIQPALPAEDIHLLKWDELTPSESIYLKEFFQRSLFPVLTPLAVDPGHPFPFISNLSVSFGVLLRHPDRPEGEELFARIKVPDVFPSWLRLPAERADGPARLISLYELVGRNLASLFPGMQILDVMTFRVTRNADVERDEEDADDLLEMVEEELRERRFARVVRLEHGPHANPAIMKILLDELQIAQEDVYQLPIGLEYLSWGPIANLDRPALKFPPWIPVVPAALADQEANIFDVIRKGDVMVHHPYESFNASVVRFIRAAVEDPNVIAIKMMIYRTGEDSPFIPLLIRAAEEGKQVACLVELKARFDEERNIIVAQALEKAGVHVVYGLVGLKTHSKTALVIRQEPDGVRCYAHIGTGNYHARTATLYTDLGLFTAKPEFTEDVVYLFHYLTGRSLHWTFRKLLVAPIDMKESFLRMIEREAYLASRGEKGHIVAKMNSLEDREIIEALYQASSMGVQIDLIVRGICCLKPGVGGVSENIRVISIVGRFLEHSRLFYFRNGAKEPTDGEFFFGSADWMQRNLGARVESIVPIEEPLLKQRCWEILHVMLHDERQAWDMRSDGTYIQRTGGSEGASSILMRLARDRDRVKQV